MFEQSFVQATATTHRGAPVALSLLLQVSVIGTGILIPLLNPDLLPSAMMGNTLFLAPPAAAPAPPPSTPASGTIARALRQLRDGVLIMPSTIPNKVADIDEPPEAAATGVGVPGSIFTGQGGGSIVDSLVHSMTRTEAPPVQATVVREPERAKPIVRSRVGGNVQDALVISRKIPEYPAMARAMRVEGKVVFQAVIGTAGTIQQLQLVSGHPLLVQAAMDAVRQWRYRPTMLNGDPIEVDTMISVNFTLNR